MRQCALGSDTLRAQALFLVMAARPAIVSASTIIAARTIAIEATPVAMATTIVTTTTVPAALGGIRLVQAIQRHLAVVIDFQDDHVDLIADVQYVLDLADAAIGHP